MQTPIYGPIHKAPGLCGMRRIDAPIGIRPDGCTIGSFADEARHARAMLLCNPHNPTGKVYSRAELALPRRQTAFIQPTSVQQPTAAPGVIIQRHDLVTAQGKRQPRPQGNVFRQVAPGQTVRHYGSTSLHSGEENNA